jgi:hypothetical protein
MQNRGRVVCVDNNRRKLQLLREHCDRLGVSICETRLADLRAKETLKDLQVDRVLVDAPCTGLGVVRRHPELKWRPGAGLSALPELVQLQRELLEAALPALGPGGLLVYSVCTLTDEEGPEQVRWLRDRHPDLQPAPFTSGPLTAAEATEGDGMGRLWPHRFGTDGFFIARLFSPSPLGLHRRSECRAEVGCSGRGRSAVHRWGARVELPAVAPHVEGIEARSCAHPQARSAHASIVADFLPVRLAAAGRRGRGPPPPPKP